MQCIAKQPKGNDASLFTFKCLATEGKAMAIKELANQA